MNLHLKPTPTTAAEREELLPRPRFEDLESDIGDVFCATKIAKEFIESRVNYGLVTKSMEKEDGNAIVFALWQLAHAVEALNENYYVHLNRQFAVRAIEAGRPTDSPSWKGPGLYRFRTRAETEIFNVRWWEEMGWYELTHPATGERMYAFCPEMFERQVCGKITNEAAIAEAAAA